MSIRLKYVYADTLPSGTVRYRFVRSGKKTRLRGEPGSPEFIAHYHELLGIDRPAPSVKGSLEWLVGAYVDYMKDMVAADQMSPLTLKQRHNQLKRVLARDDGNGSTWGKKRMDMPREKVIELRDSMAATPGEANNMVKSLRSMFAWAIERGHMQANPATKVRRLKTKSDGFLPWTVDHVRNFTKRHPYGTRAHLALSLVMFTTARRSDLCLLSRFHEREIGGVMWLRWNQAKAPHGLVEIPMMPQLIREIRDAGGDGVYLPTEYGRPFTPAGLGNWFAERCKEAKVPGRLHGVRKAVPSLLAERGVSSREIMVLLGHATPRQGEVYTAAADRRVLAEAVMDRLSEIKW